MGREARHLQEEQLLQNSGESSPPIELHVAGVVALSIADHHLRCVTQIHNMLGESRVGSYQHGVCLVILGYSPIWDENGFRLLGHGGETGL